MYDFFYLNTSIALIIRACIVESMQHFLKKVYRRR